MVLKSINSTYLSYLTSVDKHSISELVTLLIRTSLLRVVPVQHLDFSNG